MAKDSKKLHVLVIPTWYPNGVDKLMGVYHVDFCKALARDGRTKVNMLYIDRQGVSKLLDYVKMPKTFIDEFESFKLYGFKMIDISKLSFDMEMKKYAKKLCSAYYEYEKIHGKPDVLHAQVAVPAGYAACVLGEKIGVPVIITEHATYYDRFFDGAEAKYNALVMQKAKITCVGDFMRTLYEKRGIKADVLPNIVECGEFNVKRAERSEDRFNLVTICALREIKRVDNVIDAVKSLIKDIPKIHYTVIGDGDCEESYKKHSEAAGMNDYVSFVGRKTHAESAEIFSNMDAMVVASDFETFGIPAVEALAAGIPVVSTRNFGTEAFLNEKCSIMCRPQDVSDLARAIKEMHSKLNTFSADYNRSVAAGFDGARVADMAYNYYLELLESKPFFITR